MSAVLLIPLCGPMQSWGTRSRFQERDTEREPTKSGLIGLICAALGRDRSESIQDLNQLKMGVRVDCEGRLQCDFQTAQNVAVASGGETQNQISSRHYLADAVFLAALEGDAMLLRSVHEALANPVWPLYLGRKSYVPSMPPYLLNGLQAGKGMNKALMEYPLLRTSDKVKKIRLVMESSNVTNKSRMDVPICFNLGRRWFRERFVTMEIIPVESFLGNKGEGNVSFKTHH